MTYSLDDIDEMDPLEFERWAIVMLQQYGFDAYRTPQNRDGGADGIFQNRRDNKTVIIQCKHTIHSEQELRNSMRAVNDLLRARSNYQFDNPSLVAITNAVGFDRQSRKRADHENIHLVSRSILLDWPNAIFGPVGQKQEGAITPEQG